MEVKHTEIVEKRVQVEELVGIASIIKADEFIPQYTEGVERFLRDNQNLGEEWIRNVKEKLCGFQGKNKDGNLLGSSIDIGVAIATFTDIPLITGNQLLGIYEQAGKKNPFGEVYVDFGVALIGVPQVNSVRATKLLEDFTRRGINLENGRVPDFAQLRLIMDKCVGLSYKLTENVSSDDVALVSAYPFGSYVGNNGLFRACLDGDGSWYADDVGLADSDGDGRVVRYDAEGVTPRVAPKSNTQDLIAGLVKEFTDKFG